jgi:hypothetical protein
MNCAITWVNPSNGQVVTGSPALNCACSSASEFRYQNPGTSTPYTVPCTSGCITSADHLTYSCIQ